MHMKWIIGSITPALMLAGCAASDVERSPVPLTEKQAKLLDKELAGKVAGKPQNCISNTGSENFIRISDDMMLMRSTGRVVYQNKLRSTCPGLARDHDYLLIKVYGGQYCRGDIIRLVDRFSGIAGPACSLGEFIPYRKAAG